ncbi:Outer membrane protein assembly factor BamE [bacterium HR39]|nr:Outer membrane protein assembly factor BamE [bacterium HR39]
MTRARTLAALAFAALLAACAATVQEHGQRLNEADLAALRPGVSTKEEVAQILGSPSTVDPFDPNTWIYVTQKMEKVAFRTDLKDQKVLVLRFDERGVLRSLEERGLEQAARIEPLGEATPTRGAELTLLEQLIGNIGRFPRAGEAQR